MKRKRIKLHKVISVTIAVCLVLNDFFFMPMGDIFNKKADATAYDFDTSGFPVYDAGAGLSGAIIQIAAAGSEDHFGEGRIVLDKDYTENIEIPDNTAVEIDLNGHTISPSGDNARSNILVYGMLKLTDSSGGKNGALVSDGTTDISGIEVLSGGKLVFAGGTIRNYYSSRNGAGIIVEENGFMSFNGGIVENCSSELTGGGVYVYLAENAEFVNGDINGNTAENGGGIAVYRVSNNGSVLTESMTIRNNTAREYGGGLYVDYPVELNLSDTVIEKNSAKNGGGIYLSSKASLNIDENSIVSENTAQNNGGGISFNASSSIDGSSLKVSGGKINGNTSGNNGGGVYFTEATPKLRHSVVLTNAQINDNTSKLHGGGLYLYNKTDMSITGTHVDRNTAARYGGGIYISGGQTGDNRCFFTMTDSYVCENTVDSTTSTDRRGGGAYFGSRVVVNLMSGEISRNTNSNSGGGFYANDYSEVNIHDGMKINENSCFLDNGSTQGSGCYLYRCTLVMDGGEICENTTVNYGNGGGIYFYLGTAEITGGEISRNNVRGSGVGIFSNYMTYLEIGGSTVISENKNERTNESGGGIWSQNGPVEISGNALIENNENYNGGGVYVNNGVLEIRENAQIKNNKARNVGGGVHHYYSSGSKTYMMMKGGKIDNNTANNGGGIYIETSNRYAVNPSFFTGGEISGNTAASTGGGMYISRIGWNNTQSPARPAPGSTVKLSKNFVMEGNTANNGGAIYTVGGLRLELHDGGKITGNTAKNNGGGIYIGEYSVYNRDYVNADDISVSEDESLTIYGGELHDNAALNGRDLYIYERYVNNYKKPYFSAVKASSMENAGGRSYWADEISNENKTTAITNRQKIDNDEMPDHSQYTFNDVENTTARIGSTEYFTVQDAVNAIANGSAPSGDIMLIRSHRETVNIPDGVSAVLDLNGLALYGESVSVITVESGAQLTVRDSSADQSGMITDGKGTVRDNGRWGGGILCYGSLKVEGGRFTNNAASNGSAIAVVQGTLEMTGGTVDNNRFDANALTIRVDEASANISNVVLKDNQGRGIYIRGTNDNPSDVVINNLKVTGHTGYNISSVYTSGKCTVYAEDCEFTNNISSNGTGCGMIYADSGGTVYVKDTVIKKNQSGLGAGVYNVSSIIHLDNVTITENYSTGEGGGYYSNWAGSNYFKNTRIYNNYASSRGNDLRLDNSAWFYNETGNETDHRAVENLGMNDYNAWYDDVNGVYYVDNKEDHDAQGVEFLNISGDMVNPDNQRMRESKYLTAVLAPDTSEAVAEIIETGVQYATLDSAFKAALKSDEHVEIKLLKDVSEKIIANKNGADITLDFNGHTVKAVYGSTRVFYFRGVTIEFTDRTGGGKLVGVEEDDNTDIMKLPRGIYLEGSKLTISNVEISGFHCRDHGAALFCTAGYNQNGVFYNTEVYIRDGTVFKNNTAKHPTSTSNGYGGAIYFQTTANCHNVFEMTGGSFINNSAYRGGAIYFALGTWNDYTRVSITGGLFENNDAQYYGGAVFFDGNNSTADTDEVTMYGFTMRNNSSNEGGAIYGQRLTNSAHTVIFGDENVKTVFDGNTSRSNYAAVFIYNEYGKTKGIDIQNIEIKNNYSASSYVFMVNVQKLHAWNLDAHDNQVYGSEASLTLGAGELLVENCKTYNNSARVNYGGLGVFNPYANNVSGTKLVRNCESYNNTATSAAGGYCSITYDVTLENLDIHDNYCRENGGYYLLNGGERTITMDNCHFHDNKVLGAGGGIYCSGFSWATLDMKNTIIENNESGGAGGGFWIQNGNDYIIVNEGTEIRNNKAGGSGGGIYNMYANLELRSGKITGNRSLNGYGGGVYWYNNGQNSYLKMTGSEISNNTVDNLHGGGIYIEGYCSNRDYTPLIELSGGSIINNTANCGGGVFIQGNNNVNYVVPKLRITGTLIKGNTAKSSGGGLFNNSNATDTVISDDAVITENTAGSNGGGIYVEYNRTDVRLEGGKLFGNKASSGNDAFINYHGSYRNSNLYLYKASEMFGAGDEYKGLGWIDETTSAVNTEVIKLRPLGRSYPYTLSYRHIGKIVAVYNGTEYTSVTDALEDIALTAQKKGEITLVDDDVESITVESGLDVKLNLNGHTLKGGGTSTITNRGTLEIIDDKKNITVGEKHYAMSEATGRITGTSSIAGGGISVKSGSVVMSGGQISECFAGGNNTNNSYGGGAVVIEGGQFVLKGGVISDNIAKNGSAVLVKTPSAVFTMYGGEIRDNKTIGTGDSRTTGSGGAVYNRGGTVNIFGGTIKGNSAYQGGAIYNLNGTTNIIGKSASDGPVIENNVVGYNGGGVYIHNGNLTTGYCKIINNSTSYARHTDVYSSNNLAQGAGGGIYVHAASANISNGTVIKGNTAIRGGALYQLNGTVLIRGSETVITANKAQLGGGCAQSPLPGNSTTVMTLTEEASVYENKSVLTASGNDFYSAWEGTNTYEQQLGNNATYTPRLNLLAAIDMAVSNDKINVWKSDNYKGDNRTGTDLISGQFVAAEVNYGRDIQITAAYYETEAGSLIDSNFAVTNFEVGDIRDGKSAFDDGEIHDNIRFYDAAQDEKTALQLLQENAAVRSEQSYYLGSREYKYIEYNGKLYEENQIVDWHPGDDSSIDNKLVRSYDDITYVLNYSVMGDPPQQAYTTDYHTRLRIRAVLHCTPEEASFDIAGLSNAGIVSGVDESGNPIQTLTGYWSKTITPKMMGESGQSELQQENIVLKVYSMKNGALIKPEFEMWFEGNNHSLRPRCSPETVTVSAAPKYNVSIMSNPDLCQTIGYDKATKSQISKVTAEDTDPNHVNCTVTGFGITLQLYNDPSIKGLRGIELPGDELEFDLSFKGRLYGPNQSQIDNVAEAPILWAYKENNDYSFGRDLDTSSDIINMSWDDVDMKVRHSHFAYSAAPYNSGSDAQSCYDGGGWVITRSDKTAASGETKLHVKVSGYKFNNDNNPVNYSGNVKSSQLSSNAVKAFSAGYVQMLLPFSNEYSDSLQSGYYQLVMDAVVSNLDVTSVTGQIADRIVSASNLNTPELEKKDIDGMNEYYNYSDPFALKTEGYAVNERRYFDNYSNIVQAFRISNGGSGNGNGIGKTNLFCDSNKKPINGVGYNDNGLGETPLNSTVYIRGEASFSSVEIDTGNENSPYYALTDPLYNSDGFELTEYNYLTALNLLQKFDADVYTVTGTVPIIKQTSGKALTEKLGDNFSITTDESETTWSNTATKSYELTILYAAKPDGSNWVKVPKTDTSVDPIITYDDGGAADMVKYREENLLYFKSLDDLHIALGVDAKCIAILYQFRNCVFRTERSVSTYAKANVTGDFHKVGDTYCTTNDVRGWYTYRPYYKLYFADKTIAEHTYQYNWTDYLRNPGAQSTDPQKDDYEPAEYGAALPPSEFISGVPEDAEYDHSDVYSIYTQDNEYPVMLSAYTDYYLKTRYRNGVKVGGTHNGMDNGNSLLLYSVDTSIDLNVETKISGSNTVKETYTITYGERDVQYRVTPHINIASGVTKTELTRNGTQSTEIMIEIKVPKYLTYIPGSLYPDYTHSNYEKDSLVWDVSSQPGEDGTTIIKIKTFVSDIDKTLPELFYNCKIGDEMNPDNDIKESGTSLVTYAEIKAKYAETNLMAAETHSDMATINILKISQDGISESVSEHLLEIGEDIELIMTYANSTSDVVNEIQAVNVLPHIDDGRGTNFKGGYRLKKFILEFASEDDCSRFISDNGELSVSDNDMKWAVPADANRQGQYFDSFYTDTSITKTALSYTVKDEKTLEFDAEALNRIVRAYDEADNTVQRAPALYAMIPRISGDGRFNIRAILSPTDPEDDTKLISSGTGDSIQKTQIGGNEYNNSFIYRKRSSSTSFFTPISSNTVGAMVIYRSISGVAWMDQDHDGLYNTKEWVDYNNAIEGADKLAQEYPIADLKAVLYKIVPGDDPVIAEDVLGNPVEPVYTDKNGKYLFENIPPGNYTIVFGDDEDKYRFMSPYTTVPEQPVDFSELSITSTSNTQAKRGNKFLPVYDTGTDPELKGAKLNEMVINMPEKNMVPSINYNSSDWNIGLYFQDINVHKTWENMIYGIPDGTKIIFDIEGKEQRTHNVVYSAKIEMTNNVDPESNPDGEVKGYYTVDGEKPRPVALDIVENAKDHSVTWNLSDSDRIYLRAENENGVIDYVIREIRMEHYGRDVSEYYNVFEGDDIDTVTKNRMHNIANNQILGSITITKETAGDEALQNAEFSLYQVYEKGTSDSVDYYGSKSGVGDTLTEANRYRVEKTKLYNKVRIGDQLALDTLEQSGMYNAETNILTITSGTRTEEAIVHKEADYYYYNTSGTLNFSYEVIIGIANDYNNLVSSHVIDENDLYHYSNGKTYPVLRRRIGDIRQYYITVTVDPTKYEKTAIVQFDNLPLYNSSGERIYYTVRETKEPDGYISLGNFKSLTGVDLYNGGPDAQHDFSYLVVNNKQIELPLTGSNTLALIVIAGTMLMTLGALSLFLALYRKKNGRMPGILLKLLK